MDIEEALSGVSDSDVHAIVVDVVKSFDMVDGRVREREEGAGICAEQSRLTGLVSSCVFVRMFGFG